MDIKSILDFLGVYILFQLVLNISILLESIFEILQTLFALKLSDLQSKLTSKNSTEIQGIGFQITSESEE